MWGFSGVEGGTGFTGGETIEDGRETGDGAGLAGGATEPAINSLIRSTVGGSMTASALVLTSRPHFWIRSISS
jgi:hypothetical protein